MPFFRSAIAVAALAGLSSFAAAQTPPAPGAAAQHGSAMHQGQVMGSAAAEPGSRELHHSMMTGMQDMQRRPIVGDTDTDFIRLMRQHHLGGIEMARIQLQRGDDPEARRMAQKILESQQEDVARFDRWLQRNQ